MLNVINFKFAVTWSYCKKITVISTVLYGRGGWTMTKQREHLLQTNVRRILGKMYGCLRKAQENSQETWVDWIQCATHEVEDVMKSMYIDS